MMPIEIGTVLYAGAIGLVVIGIAGIVLSHHLFRIILALVIAEAGANLLLVLSGFRWDAIAPIITGGAAAPTMVDPVPQAMVLTSIVIGVGVQALALSLMLRAYGAYKTLDIRELQRRMSADLAGEAGTPLPQSLEEPVGGRPLPAAGGDGR
ncbi:MAG: NADH-quinone oxidoreductase subunit K [gamma proteobacterium endosymbiont of Lamellibrachia anaximandri]|nr:NADH-quinone oxidoreductase subunit K [gamma proteobacterium endosymbiont of Lamellibrachia anaximandri]MBL3534254.1 NADH-quinone oxidoreductase subunit K [gamma proteobacterium endosymbiont of Lamellibrachia anaximandri]